MMRRMREGAARFRAEEAERKRLAAEAEARKRAWAEAHPEEHLANLRSELERHSASVARRRRRIAELANRRSFASRERARNLAQLSAAPESVGRGGRGGRRAPAGKSGRRSKKAAEPVDDGFGADDADWDVYKANDLELEQESLAEDEAAADRAESELRAAERALRERRGELTAQDLETVEERRVRELRQEIAAQHQVKLTSERYLAPEAVFQPSLVGVRSMGLSEVIGAVVRQLGRAALRDRGECRMSGGSASRKRRRLGALAWEFGNLGGGGGAGGACELRPPRSRGRAALGGDFSERLGAGRGLWAADRVETEAVRRVLLTGGMAAQTGMLERIAGDLRAALPAAAGCEVRLASDPTLDAWRGAAVFARNAERLRAASVTRAEWAEKGPGYLAEHGASNAWLPAPTPAAPLP
jgi:hypothetical protein